MTSNTEVVSPGESNPDGDTTLGLTRTGETRMFPGEDFNEVHMDIELP